MRNDWPGNRSCEDQVCGESEDGSGPGPDPCTETGSMIAVEDH